MGQRDTARANPLRGQRHLAFAETAQLKDERAVEVDRPE